MSELWWSLEPYQMGLVIAIIILTIGVLVSGLRGRAPEPPAAPEPESDVRILPTLAATDAADSWIDVDRIVEWRGVEYLISAQGHIVEIRKL
jgi:hypothetical protein